MNTKMKMAILASSAATPIIAAMFGASVLSSKKGTSKPPKYS